MTLDINMLNNNTIPLQFKTQTITSSIPMCYYEHHDANTFFTQTNTETKLLTLTNSIVTINERDTLRPLGLYVVEALCK